MRQHNRKREYPDLLTTILGMSIGEFEWRRISDIKKLIAANWLREAKARQAAVAKLIAEDWLSAAKAQAAEIAKLVQQDQALLAEQAEREWLENDSADSAIVARRMADKLANELAPVFHAALEKQRKERRKMNRAVKREREKLEAAGRKLATLKLREFRNRR